MLSESLTWSSRPSPDDLFSAAVYTQGSLMRVAGFIRICFWLSLRLKFQLEQMQVHIGPRGNNDSTPPGPCLRAMTNRGRHVMAPYTCTPQVAARNNARITLCRGSSNAAPGGGVISRRVCLERVPSLSLSRHESKPQSTTRTTMCCHDENKDRRQVLQRGRIRHLVHNGTDVADHAATPGRPSKASLALVGASNAGKWFQSDACSLLKELIERAAPPLEGIRFATRTLAACLYPSVT